LQLVSKALGDLVSDHDASAVQVTACAILNCTGKHAGDALLGPSTEYANALRMRKVLDQLSVPRWLESKRRRYARRIGH
jgi:hypothetical protein